MGSAFSPTEEILEGTTPSAILLLHQQISSGARSHEPKIFRTQEARKHQGGSIHEHNSPQAPPRISVPVSETDLGKMELESDRVINLVGPIDFPGPGNTVISSGSTSDEVASLHASITSAVTRVLGRYNVACVRPKHIPPFRIGNRFHFELKEVVELPKNFVSYHEWNSNLTNEANNRGDKEKEESLKRIAEVESKSWSVQEVADRLGCTSHHLDIILDSVRDLKFSNPLRALALLPPSAHYPSESISIPSRKMSSPWLEKVRMIIPPNTKSDPLRIRDSPRGKHPKGLKSWPISDTFTPSGLRKWKTMKWALKEVGKALTTRPVGRFIRHDDVWISEASDMNRFVHNLPVAIDQREVCTWKNISDKPVPKFASTVNFIRQEIKVASGNSIAIRDLETVSHIQYGFRLDSPGLARGIGVSFPSEKIYEEAMLTKLDQDAAEAIREEQMVLLCHPSSTQFRAHACGVVAKANTNNKRIIKNMSAPYNSRDKTTHLLISTNQAQREERGERDKKHFWWLQQPDFQFNAAVVNAASAHIRAHHLRSAREFTPTSFTSDAKQYYDSFNVDQVSEDLVSSFTTTNGALSITKCRIPGFGSSKVPDICQAAANIRCSIVASHLIRWLLRSFALAEKGDETASVMFPETYRNMFRARRTMFPDEGKQWALAPHETYVDDTGSDHLSWSACLAAYIIGIAVDTACKIDHSWHKLQFGQLVIHLGLLKDTSKGTLKLTPESLLFFRHYLLRAREAEVVEHAEVEAVVSKLIHKLALVPGAMVRLMRTFRWLHNSKAWNKSTDGIPVAPAQEFWKRDVVEGIISELAEDPEVPLDMFTPSAGSSAIVTFTDSCRHRKKGKFCGMGGVTLLGSRAIIWALELTPREVRILPVHVTEAWATLINLYVLAYLMWPTIRPEALSEGVDNKAAVHALSRHRSKDPRFTDIILMRKDFCDNTKTAFGMHYVPTVENPADLPSRGKIRELVESLQTRGWNRKDIAVINLADSTWSRRLHLSVISERLISTTIDMQDPNKSMCALATLFTSMSHDVVEIHSYNPHT